MQIKNDYINRLEKNNTLDPEEFLHILDNTEYDNLLFSVADKVRKERYGDAVYVRGLIEFTNFCKNNCYYCGIRAGNADVSRYRLDLNTIMRCCEKGYELGYRTFVLQGGEDLTYSEADICRIVDAIKCKYGDCAVTLSIGEKTRENYLAYFNAGADRFLLRHETAVCEHYAKLHPDSMSLDNRKRCLYDLKEIGYQVGAGFMVGSPYQKTEYIIQDLLFLKELEPDMIGIGPFLTHRQTPFAAFPNGSLELTLRLISILRLMFPYALIPATTALATIAPDGRERGLKAGANVIMPNLSPIDVREKYTLYDNKKCTGSEAAEQKRELEKSVADAGYRVVTDIGHVKR